MDKLLGIIPLLGPLLSLIPGGGAAPEIVAAVLELVKYIKEQSGLTTDQILDRAGVTLDDNERELLKDKIRLGG
ncbi:MAG: hypothetical protein QOD33_1133 [Pyrinomonadaceae bacterium]|nr:hypothetical protein [Pyrinomonadaceae bacterium]